MIAKNLGHVSIIETIYDDSCIGHI